MLYLVFHVGPDAYLIEGARILRVGPLRPLRRVPDVPRAIAGMTTFLGRAIPVVDCSVLIAGTPAPNRLSTRIVYLACRLDDGTDGHLALIAERLANARKIEEGVFAPPPVDMQRTPFLRDVVLIEGKLHQRLDLDGLLTPEVKALLHHPVFEEA